MGYLALTLFKPAVRKISTGMGKDFDILIKINNGKNSI